MPHFPANRCLGLRVLGVFVALFLAYWAVNLALGVGPNWILRQLHASPDVRTYVGSTISYGGRLAALVLLSAWGVRTMLHHDVWDLLFPTGPGWWKKLTLGLALSVTGMFLLFLVETQAGWLTVEAWNWQQMAMDAWLRNLWLAFLVNATVAVGEEALFRGYLLTGLVQAWGIAPGVLVVMFIFASVHLLAFGAEHTAWYVFVPLLSVPGLMLALAYLRSGSLWLPIGIHFGWNLMQDEIFNLHGRGVSQLIGAITIQHGPPWVVGTAYGIEVGLLGIVLACLICLAVRLLVRPTRADALR